MAISIKEVYVETIQKGLTAADMIKDATAKANAYAALAAAMVPLVEREKGASTDDVKGKDGIKKGNNKGKNKKSTTPAETATPVATDAPLSADPINLEEEVAGEVIENAEVQETVETVETQETVETADAAQATAEEEAVPVMETEEVAEDNLAEEFEGFDEETLNRLRQDPALLEDLRWHIQLVTENGEEVLNQYVPIWSEGLYQTLDDITLDNVQSFVTYMKSCIEG